MLTANNRNPEVNEVKDIEVQKSELDANTKKHPAYMDVWNVSIENEMKKSPNGTYAIITSCARYQDLLEAALLDEPKGYTEFLLIHTKDGKLTGYKVVEEPGFGVVGNYSSGRFTTFGAPTITEFLAKNADTFQLPFNEYRQQQKATATNSVAVSSILHSSSPLMRAQTLAQTATPEAAEAVNESECAVKFHAL